MELGPILNYFFCNFVKLSRILICFDTFPWFWGQRGHFLGSKIQIFSLSIFLSVPLICQINGKNYPFQLEPNNPGRNDVGRSIRTTTTKLWKDDSKSKAASESVSRDATKLWNAAPDTIKNAPNLYGAKRMIKDYCKTLEL